MDLAMPERALARLEAPDTKVRRSRRLDSLIQFLQSSNYAQIAPALNSRRHRSRRRRSHDTCA